MAGRVRRRDRYPDHLREPIQPPQTGPDRDRPRIAGRAFADPTRSLAIRHADSHQHTRAMTYPTEMRTRLAVVIAAIAPLSACGPDETAGACKDNLIAGDLVITEVFADYAAPTGGTGTDDGKEWFEIYNNADRPVSLKGLTIVHSRPDGSKSKSHTMDDVTVAPGQFFTLGNATDDLVPAYVDYGYSADLGDFFNSDGGKLALKCGDSEVDSATYDTVKSGHSRQLSNQGPPDYTLNDDLANWCEAKDTEFEPSNFGTPGQDNDCAPVIAGSCSDTSGMRPVVAPNPGDLVITEVMPNPAAADDTKGEWFEVTALNPVDLNGIGLARSGSTPVTVDSPSCLHLEAGQYSVFARSTDMAMNGGIPTPIAGTFGFTLVNTSGDLQILSGATVLDTITWSTSSNGKSLQLDPDFIDPTANDEPTNFCDATATYGMGDSGTPNAANTQCSTIAPEGMCDDGGTLRPIVKPTMGTLVITEVMPNPKVPVTTPATSEASREWFEITNVGSAPFDLNGLGLDRSNDSTPVSVVSGPCKSLAPGGYALFAKSADAASNSGLPAPDATFGMSLLNSNGDVQVVDPASCTANECTTVYDRVTWTSTVDGESKQVKPGATTTTPTANDDPANFCPGIAPYGDMMNKG
ncbi:MAG: lamin tail domain-containing protein, partial [Kofleriaceae bacterium]|nr:lamin tail domain-containing protein [Kofleriaceae bacterium]